MYVEVTEEQKLIDVINLRVSNKKRLIKNVREKIFYLTHTSTFVNAIGIIIS